MMVVFIALLLVDVAVSRRHVSGGPRGRQEAEGATEDADMTEDALPETSELVKRLMLQDLLQDIQDLNRRSVNDLLKTSEESEKK